ncbi:MAG TPA: hypothetical protein VN088_20820 [Nocardioides sp.]|nr:hypothetical protein [Nocardioides sp.]
MKALLALVVLVLVAGCGAADPPAADPTPTVASSSTPPAKQLSPEQTVRAWVQGYNRFAQTGAEARVDQLTASGCAMCRSLTGSVAQVINAGGGYRGGDWVVVKAKVASRHDDTTIVDAAVRANAGWTKEAAGEPFKRFGSDRYILEFTVRRWPDGTMQVQKLVSLS